VIQVIGIDLAGPAGAASTAVACFALRDRALHFEAAPCDGSDTALHELVRARRRVGPVVVGIDAPLSYEPGGGQRGRDADLRRLIVRHGMRPGSIMAPTAPRMVYLTLRGIALAHAFAAGGADAAELADVAIVEVHPGACMRLRGAELRSVTSFAGDAGCRAGLLSWLERQGLRAIAAPTPCSSHFVAACAAALGAWRWHEGEPAWVAPAEPPWHPYDFAC
jgi:predicted nuclease with RNAse H fold